MVTAAHLERRLNEISAALGGEVGQTQKEERERIEARLLALEKRIAELEEEATRP